MPYKDPDKAREASRLSHARRLAANRDEINAKRRARYAPIANQKSEEQRQRHTLTRRRSYDRHRQKYQAAARARYHATKHFIVVRNRRRVIRDILAGRPRPDRCEVCGGTGRIDFDHCHQRGIFRGWLCSGCNWILGIVDDNPNRLRMLIAYLDRTNKLVSPQLTLPL